MARHLEANLPCPKCDSSDALTVYKNGSYCFSCHYKTHNKTKVRPSLLADAPSVGNLTLGLPSTFSGAFSDKAGRMILQYGISEHYLNEAMIGYVENEHVPLPGTKHTLQLRDRIIIPMKDDTGAFLGYQARAVSVGNKPKYITLGVKRPYIVPGMAVRFDLDKPLRGHVGRVAVLVEDVFSALKIASAQGPEVRIEPIALLGTSLSDEFLLTLHKNYDKIIVWLDSDLPGQKAAKQIQRRLQLYIKEVINVATVQDPKKCFNDTIRQTLKLTP